jgi:hypothetical protein
MDARHSHGKWIDAFLGIGITARRVAFAQEISVSADS